MRRFLEAYDERLSLTANDFEAALFRLLRRAGLPLPEPQKPIFDESAFVRRVDFVYRRERIDIEADGARFHSDPRMIALDNDRRNRLQLDGWIVLHFSWTQVMHRPNQVVNEVKAALRRRGALD